jgi:GLPGLI family protein
MLKIHLIIVLLMLVTFSLAQQNKQTAYVEFVYNNGNSMNQTIVLKFNAKECLETVYPPSARNWNNFKTKQYNSLSDSLHDAEMIKLLDSFFIKTDTRTIYKNIEDAYFIRSSTIDEKKYCYYDTIPPRDWELTSDTLTIAGYKCLKANFEFKSGQKGFVWYCPDIPVPFGPETLYGLPGFILEVGSYNSNYSIKLKKIQIPFNDNNNLQPCNNAKLVTKAQYQKLINENNNNFEKMMLQLQKSN